VTPASPEIQIHALKAKTGIVAIYDSFSELKIV
jgi:hypothetical protein